MSKELLSRAMRGFNSPDSPKELRNQRRTAVTGDAWMRQPTQPKGHRNDQRTAVTGDVWIRQPMQP
jgi:hypothetical protein